MLHVLYDDGPVLVVNKPAGLLTQAPRGIDSLELWVRDYYRAKERNEGNFYLGLVHRIDRPVTGAIVFGRNLRATQRLAKQFEERTVSKTYWALVEGRVEPDEGTWRDQLHKRHGMAAAIVVPEDDPRGKQAVLHYRVRWRSELADGSRGWTWLEIELETGRTHQIRVQAASRGHAVLGDAQYGAEALFGPTAAEREAQIALHARTLAFRHPMKDESVSVAAPLGEAWRIEGAPDELLAALE
ncbi:MAG: RluA family pseudouridine synthase [Lacipirellulaceae bacterium]